VRDYGVPRAVLTRIHLLQERRGPRSFHFSTEFKKGKLCARSSIYTPSCVSSVSPVCAVLGCITAHLAHNPVNEVAKRAMMRIGREARGAVIHVAVTCH